MTGSSKKILAVLATVLVTALVGCTDQRRTYFSGRVYDGVTGSRLVGYEIELQYLDRRIKGQVDPDGRYLVGPLLPMQDYTVAIRATGYRSFLSHNMMQADMAPKVDQSFYFDAYLYPTEVLSPEATLRVTLADAADAPAGAIRLRPTTHSAFFDAADEMPAGVGTQVWDNDEDLQFAAVSRDFSDGVLELAAGDLVYGVTYAVTVYNVKGHKTVEGTFTAGEQRTATFTVAPLGEAPVTLSFVSTELGVPVATGEVVFVLNQPVALDPLKTEGAYLAAVAANFSISSPDANMNNTLNALRPFDPLAPASRGVTLTVSGNKVTLKWDPAVALLTTDPADPIRAVTYGGLDAIQLRPVGAPLDAAVSLGTLFGAPSVTVPVTP